MGYRPRRIFTAARMLAETLLDGVAGSRCPPRTSPATEPSRGRPVSPTDGRTRERVGVVRLMLRLVAALGIPWSCRRSAFTLYRALAREGIPARLFFGIRRARADESRGGSYVGHVWASRGTQQDAEAGRAEFPLVITYPAARENAGWRRG